MNHSQEELFYQAEDYFLGAISRKCVYIDDGIITYITGIPVKNFNVVCVRNKIKSTNNFLNKVEEFYNNEGLPFIIIIPEKFCTQNTNANFEKLGYKQIENSVSMAINLETKANIKNQHKSKIRIDYPNLKNWILPLTDAFESTLKTASQYKIIHENAIINQFNLHHFSLYENSDPISSITLSNSNNIARIDDLGTLSGFRGNGYATSLVNHSLQEAVRLGAKYCFLESSDSGLSIYQKLGFQALFKNNIYSQKNN